MPAASLTIVIPTWNRRDLLARCLAAVREGEAAQLLVVDNGSQDDSATYAEAQGAQVLRLPVNLGFAAAVNAALHTVKTPWVAILNNDVEVEPGYFTALQQAAMQSGAGWATGKILNAQQRDLLDATIDAVSRAGCPWRVGHGRQDRAAAGWLGPGAARLAPLTAALFRSEVFDRIGLLDERFESYLEDVDFGLRAALAGVTGCYVDTARAYHLGSATLGPWHGDTARRLSRNQLWLIAKHFPAGWVSRYGWAVLVGQALWILVAFRHGAGWPALRGKWEALRSYREIRGEGPPANSTERLAALLEESEQEIEAAQRATGWDSYWKWYFRLT